MAISKSTPKDVGTYEAKLLGPFTQRQVVCLGVGIVPCVLIAGVLHGIGADGYSIAALCLLLMVPSCVMAFGSKLCHGMKPEDFIAEYYYYHVKSSNVRLYETSTLDDRLDVVRRKKIEKENQKFKTDDKNKKETQKQKSKSTVTKVKYKDMRFEQYPHKKSKQYRSFS